jgi:glycosyltransferase involved in cell wall biosynthesis
MNSSNRIAILAPYPRHEAPSQRFRFEQYLGFLEENDISIKFYPFLNHKAWTIFYHEGKYFLKAVFLLLGFIKRFLLLFSLLKYDFIFIHREAAPIGPPIFEWIIAKVLRKKYIYDFDDAIWMPNYSQQHARFHRMKAYWKIKHIIKWSYKVSAGNAFLARYAQNYCNNVVLIPTTIDTEHLHISNTKLASSEIVIGWTGSHSTLPYLTMLLPVLNLLSKKYTFTFRVISNEEPNFELKNLSFIKWNKESEIEDLATFSIGVMPLTNDAWSEGKCGFKALQYMALSIPTVLSPVGVNVEIVQDQVNGLFADTESEWHAQLELLIKEEALRKQIGEAGRKTVVNAYSVLSQKENYLKLFK